MCLPGMRHSQGQPRPSSRGDVGLLGHSHYLLTEVVAAKCGILRWPLNKRSVCLTQPAGDQEGRGQAT